MSGCNTDVIGDNNASSLPDEVHESDYQILTDAKKYEL